MKINPIIYALLGAASAIALSAHAGEVNPTVTCKNLPFENLSYLSIEETGYGDYLGSMSGKDGKLTFFNVLTDEVNSMYDASRSLDSALDQEMNVSGFDSVKRGMGLIAPAPSRNELYYLRYDGKKHYIDQYFVNPGTFAVKRIASVECEGPKIGTR